MKKPLFSIITVVYNNKIGIEKTINSVINQNYSNLEYIIIDGGSTDGTVDVIKKYSSFVTKFISESDFGIYDAMNKGLRNANGEIIGIINSGDHLEPKCLQTLENVYLLNPSYDVYHGLMRFYSESEELICIRGNNSACLPDAMIEHSTCFVKRSAYERYGDFSLEYKVSSDYDFFLRLWKQNAKFYFIESILANFYLGGISSKPLGLYESLKIRHKHGLLTNTQKYFNKLLINIKLRYSFHA